MTSEDRADPGPTAATPDSAGHAAYYDPGEVEAYVREASAAIKALQARVHDEVRRADNAELALEEYHPEAAGLGRALLLAGEIADKTINDADAKASEILSTARNEAAAILEGAQRQAGKLTADAQDQADVIYRRGEARLRAAVDAFVEGAEVLRAELNKVRAELAGGGGRPESADRGAATLRPAPDTKPQAGARPVSGDQHPMAPARDGLLPLQAGHPVEVAPFVPPSFPWSGNGEPPRSGGV